MSNTDRRIEFNTPLRRSGQISTEEGLFEFFLVPTFTVRRISGGRYVKRQRNLWYKLKRLVDEALAESENVSTLGARRSRT